jgi:ABC-2 type transport system ATP-binding protein
MRGARAATLVLVVALLSVVVPVPSYAREEITETALQVLGTPEPDGKPVALDTTIVTTDPATPRPAIVLAHGFGGTKADSEPTARTLALAGYTVIILHGTRLRRLRRPDSPGQSRVRRSRRPQSS